MARIRDAVVKFLLDRDGPTCSVCRKALSPDAPGGVHVFSPGDLAALGELALAHPDCEDESRFSGEEWTLLGSQWGAARNAKRRQFDEEATVERLDKRRTKGANFKSVRITMTISPEGLAIADARRQAMNYGRGMTRSAYVEFLIRAHNKSGRKAPEFKGLWPQDERRGEE